MRGWSKGEKDWLFPRVLTSIAMTFAVVPRIHPRVNITNYFSAFWKEGAAQAEQVYTQKNVDLVEDLGRAAGFTSRRPPWPLWGSATLAVTRGRVPAITGKRGIEFLF